MGNIRLFVMGHDTDTTGKESWRGGPRQVSTPLAMCLGCHTDHAFYDDSAQQERKLKIINSKERRSIDLSRNSWYSACKYVPRL
jgi:hypothetical protein